MALGVMTASSIQKQPHEAWFPNNLMSWPTIRVYAPGLDFSSQKLVNALLPYLQSQPLALIYTALTVSAVFESLAGLSVAVSL